MSYEIETRCIHGEGGGREKHSFGAVTVPIYQTATFSHPEIGKSTGFDYSRVDNPTRRELEKTVAALEGALDAVAFSTGMAAITLCLELFEEGSHFVCTEDLYGGSVRAFNSIGVSRGRTFTYVDTSDEKAVEAAITSKTRAIYVETPSNPTMQVTDLAAMRRLADKYHLLLIVDNTFLSPYYQNPIAFGTDLVIHSGTKFLAGHNDTLAGFLCTARADLAEKIRYLYMTTGACLSPFDSFLVLRGIKTLAVRMEAQQKNAMRIAAWLKEQKQVKEVYYVGLPEHPGYEVSKRQTRGFGSMISFRTDSEETARRILNHVQLITYAESLGGVESLITYPMLQTHADVPVEIRERLGITSVFLRLSVGIENCDDLIADLKQAMEGNAERKEDASDVVLV